MSMGLIIFYGMVGIATVVCYVNAKIVFRPLTGVQVQDLRNQIIDKGVLTERQLTRLERWEEYHGSVPMGDATLTGVQDWRQLSWIEMEMYARPSVGFYLCHQLIMLATCMWVCIYLFIPLVLHHRHGPVGRPVDGDMMAVGVWYLSSLMTLAAAYAILNVVYCVDNEFIFEQQAQALDLCMRITIGPIFFLPAPPFLLRFYRERFRKMRCNNGSGGRNGSANRTGGSGTNHFNGSFTTNSAVGNTSPEATQVESRIGTTGNSSMTRCSHDINSDANHKHQESTSPPLNHGRFKVFTSNDRSTSAESSRVLNKDFECESYHDGHGDSLQLYSSTLNSVTLDINDDAKEKKMSYPFDPLQNEELLQYPKPVLTEQHLRATKNEVTSGWKDMERMLKRFDHSKEGSSQASGSGVDMILHTRDTSKADDQLDAVTGSTGWEVGGYGSQEPGAPSKPLSTDDDKQTPSNETPTPSNETPTPSNETPSPFEHLTGLQRQLAEHSSALLPKVLAYQAYHEDLATAEPFDHKLKPINPYDLSARQDSGEAHVVDMAGASGRADDNIANGLHEAEPKSPIHLVDPTHWLPPRTWNKPEETYNSTTTSASGSNVASSGSNVASSGKAREHKSKDGLIAAFKALNSKDKGSHAKE
ncbi:hypothetical protein BGZ65_008245, partial [Modicella reniformis]